MQVLVGEFFEGACFPVSHGVDTCLEPRLTVFHVECCDLCHFVGADAHVRVLVEFVEECADLFEFFFVVAFGAFEDGGTGTHFCVSLWMVYAP